MSLSFRPFLCILYSHFFLGVRSVGVANFNAHHLAELKKARPDNVPLGEWNGYIEWWWLKAIFVAAWTKL